MSQRYNFRSVFVFPLVILLFFLFSCQKRGGDSAPSNTSKLELYLTDAPGDYQKAWLDIQKVRVRIDADNSQNTQAGSWQELPIVHSERFDLLSLRNGNNALVAAGEVAAGTLREISLILGDNNSVELNNGISVQMKTPDSIHSDAMLLLNRYSRSSSGSGIHHLVVDFDVSKSISSTFNPSDSSQRIYQFVPYTRTFSKDAGGAIEGWVFPPTVQTTITAINNTHDTLSTQSESGGYFKLWGLPEGDYTIHYIPTSSSGYQKEKINDIQISEGQLFTSDTVRLHQ